MLPTVASPTLNRKRYLILTYVVEFDRCVTRKRGAPFAIPSKAPHFSRRQRKIATPTLSPLPPTPPSPQPPCPISRRVHYPLPLAFEESQSRDQLLRLSRRLRRELFLFRELAGLSASTPALSANGLAPMSRTALVAGVDGLRRENATLREALTVAKERERARDAAAESARGGAAADEFARSGAAQAHSDDGDDDAAGNAAALSDAQSALENLRNASRAEVGRLRLEIDQLRGALDKERASSVGGARVSTRAGSGSAGAPAGAAAETIAQLERNNEALKRRVAELSRQLTIGVAPRAAAPRSPARESSPVRASTPSRARASPTPRAASPSLRASTPGGGSVISSRSSIASRGSTVGTFSRADRLVGASASSYGRAVSPAPVRGRQPVSKPYEHSSAMAARASRSPSAASFVSSPASRSASRPVSRSPAPQARAGSSGGQFLRRGSGGAGGVVGSTSRPTATGNISGVRPPGSIASRPATPGSQSSTSRASPVGQSHVVLAAQAADAVLRSPLPAPVLSTPARAVVMPSATVVMPPQAPPIAVAPHEGAPQHRLDVPPATGAYDSTRDAADIDSRLNQLKAFLKDARAPAPGMAVTTPPGGTPH